ncbi:MAG: alpha/beta fold hydrolase [Myxococcota bacterium]
MLNRVTLSDNVREYPIIFVPGIMGTRLTGISRGERHLFWNPMGQGDEDTWEGWAERQAGMSDPGPARRHHTFETRGGPQPCSTFLSNLRLGMAGERGYFPYTTAREHRRHLAKAGIYPQWGNQDYRLIQPAQAHPDHSLGTAYEVVGSYVPLLSYLTHASYIEPDGVVGSVRPRVVTCGYDWRQSCIDSARTLQTRVRQVRQVTGSRDVIIIAHSMGGLVTRYFCKHLAEPNEVRSVILLASPSLGAPESYTRLKGGVDMTFLGMLLGSYGAAAYSRGREYARMFQSAYDLMPTPQYRAPDGSNWAEFESSKTGFDRDRLPPDNRRDDRTFETCRSRYFYHDLYTGIADGGCSPNQGIETVDRRRVNVARLTRRAKTLHHQLRGYTTWRQQTTRLAYQHPRTYLVWSKAHETVEAVRVQNVEPMAANDIMRPRPNRGTLMLRRINPYGEFYQPAVVDPIFAERGGDGSVPTASASGLIRGRNVFSFWPNENAVATFGEAQNGHQDIPNEQGVMARCARWINAELFPGTPFAGYRRPRWAPPGQTGFEGSQTGAFGDEEE